MGRTDNGIRYMSLGYLVYIVMSIILLVMAGLMFFSPRDFYGMICFASIPGLVGIIFFLIGFYNIYKGKKNFPDKHKMFVNLAVVLLLIGIIFSFGSDLVIDDPKNKISSNIDYYRENQQQAKELLKDYFIQKGIADMVSNICYALFSVFLILKLAPESSKKLLWAGAGVNIVLQGAIVGAFYFVFDINNGVLDALYDLIQVVAFLGGMTIVGYVLFYRAYRETNRKIKWGKKKSYNLMDEDSEEQAEAWRKNPNLSRCPKCDEKAARIEDDGSGYCYNCGFSSTDMNGYKEDE